MSSANTRGNAALNSTQRTAISQSVDSSIEGTIKGSVESSVSLISFQNMTLNSIILRYRRKLLFPVSVIAIVTTVSRRKSMVMVFEV